MSLNSPSVEALVVGSGPNGMAAAIRLARQGLAVRVVEAKSLPGGGCRTLELTEPGFGHDVCAAVHPLGLASPCFRELELEAEGLQWVHPEIPLAHPMAGGGAVALHRKLDKTADGLGEDGDAWRKLFTPFVENFEELVSAILSPPHFPRQPFLLARFGLSAILSARGLAESRFRTPAAQLLFAGIAAHGKLPLEKTPGASFGLPLAAAAHAKGWPVARTGTGAIIDAMRARLERLGGEVLTETEVTGDRDLFRLAPNARLVLFDLTPHQLLRIGGDKLPRGYRRRLLGFRYGTGVFKIDWALDGPIPWRDEACRHAGTVHLGGTLEEISRSARLVHRGRHPEHPYVILVQPSLFDPSRAPEGKQTAWGYCHVPAGSNEDCTETIEAQVERYAPGFCDLVRARHTMTARGMEGYNPNYVGGDIGSGDQDLRQTLFRPFPTPHPYRIPVPGWFLCSASTPPGGGVHGMCGNNAADAALRWLEKKE